MKKEIDISIEINRFLSSKGLTFRQTQICELVSRGFKNACIGDMLGIHEKTVKFHLTLIYKQMEIKSRSELIVMCLNSKSMLVDHFENMPIGSLYRFSRKLANGNEQISQNGFDWQDTLPRQLNVK